MWLAVAIALQVLVFNHLSIFGGVVMVYSIALLKLPVETNRVAQIFIGFLTGLIIDVFCNTLGMNAFAGVTLMLFRDPILHLYVNDPEFKSGNICYSRIGLASFMRYSLTIIGFNCLLIYGIEACSLFNIGVLLVKMIVSTLLTFVMVMAFETATLKK